MRIFFILFFSLSIVSLQAQLVNQGGTITVKTGATLVVESNVTNTTGSIVLESGATLNVKGNFSNAATMTFDPASQTIFSGTANSTVTSGSGSFGNFRLNKTAADVVLADAMTINGQLDFAAANNKIVLGSNNLTLGSSATVNGAGSDKYVQADAAGQLIKKLTGTGSTSFPVGDATSYSPLTANVTAGTFGPNAYVAVKLTDSAHPSKYTDATEYITRYWEVSKNDITGYAATLSGTYTDGDVTGSDESLIFGTFLNGSTWEYTNSTSNPATNTIGVDVGDVGTAVLFGQNKYGSAILKAYLAGALSGTAMTTTLNSILPMTTPYTAAPFNAPSVTATSIPTNATDWILVEVRDAVTPSTVISKTSGFILNDGSIVGVDGGTLKLKNATSTGHIALRHRNHLAIRTASPLDLVNPSLHDFSSGTGQAYTDPGNTTNANMRLLSSLYCMWNGDANQNGIVSYNGGANDRTKVLAKVGGSSTPNNTVSGYFQEDLNLNGIVSYNGGANDRNQVLAVVGGSSTPNNTITNHL